MIALVLKATLLLLLAVGIDALFGIRRTSAAARHLLWTMTVCALLVLPLATVALPAWRVVEIGWARAGSAGFQIDESIRSDLPAPEVASAPVSGHEVLPGLVPESTMPPAASALTARAAETRGSIPGATALIAYLAIALLLIVRVLAEHAFVGTFARRFRHVTSCDLARMLDAARATMRVRRPIALYTSATATMPLTWGVRRPGIVLPEIAAGWPVERQRAVLLHEVAHVARHDCLTQTLAALACAIYWPHPGAWWAAHRLRVERELACDALAVSSGVTRFRYARDLLEVARACRAPRFAAGAVAFARTRLEGRLRAIVAGRPALPLTRRQAVAASAAALALLLPLGAMAPATPAAITPEETAPAPRSSAEDAAFDEAADASLPPQLPRQQTPAQPAASISAADPSADDAATRSGTGTLRVASANEAPAAGEDTLADIVSSGNNSLSTTAPVPAAAPPVPVAQERTPLAGTWTRRAGAGGAHVIELFWDDGTNWRRVFDASRVTAAGAATWLLDRDAGRFELRGGGAGATSRGDFTFTPNRNFAVVLRDLGFVPAGAVTDHNLKNLAWGNVGVRELRAFRERFADLSFEQVVSFAIYGVTPEYVDGMAAAGARMTPRDMTDLLIYGIRPDQVREAVTAGLTDRSASAIRRAIRDREAR